MLFKIIETFKNHAVNAYTVHKIYGTQEMFIRCFQPLYENNKVGFIVEKHKIFMYHDEIEDFKFNNNTIEINGSLQKFIIEKI
jgi:hypothetical protein